jgi:hypothetical protein
MAFTQKVLQASFSLANGSFAGGGNSATVTGESATNLRMSATIVVAGSSNPGNMELAIYGLPLSLMNQLSTVGNQYWQMAKNSITLSAGEVGGQMSVVFQGQIFNAFVDAAAMPQVAFRLTCNPGGAGFNAMKPVAPISFQGPKKASDMLSQLAGQMGFSFENNGVKTMLTNPYYPGNAWTQAWRIARHAGADLWVERGVMAVAPAGTSRTNSPSTLAPPKMVGYPAFKESGIIVKSYFDPSYSVGNDVTVTSSLTPASGKWNIIQIIHELDCFMPHGKWFSTLITSSTQANPSQRPAGPA